MPSSPATKIKDIFSRVPWRKLLAHPAAFFVLAMPVPVWCALAYYKNSDATGEMIGWVFPVMAAVTALLAGGLIYLAHRRKRQAVLSPQRLCCLLGVALLFCAFGNYHAYKTIYMAQWAEIGIVISSSLLMTMGGMCLFWALLKRWSLVIWVPFLLLGMLQAIGFLEYGTVLNSLVLAEIMETSWEEALAYLTFSNILFIILALGMVTGFSWLLCRALRNQGRMVSLNSGVLLMALSLLVALPVPLQDEDTDLYWPYAEAYRVYLIADEALNVNYATKECVDKLPSPAQDPSELAMLKGDEGIVLVVHIGESVRADRMGINGYTNNGKSTTPWLCSQVGNGLINFPRCISAAADTCKAQITILTDGRRDIQDTTEEYMPKVGSVLDLFVKHGFDMYCFRGRKVAEKLKYDYVVHKLTHAAKRGYNADGSPWTIVPTMEKVLDEVGTGKNVVFFINNEGSHTPFAHYDHDNTPFTPAVDSFEIPSKHAVEVNNAYDSTIHYTDEYVRRVAEVLKGRPFVYLYVSDHGEYLGHDGIWGRGGLGSSKLSYHETSGCCVGMFIYYSPEFAKADPHFAEALDHIAANASKTVAHEHIFHTLLGLFQLKTQHYNPELDLCNPDVKPYDGPQPQQ